MSSYFFQDINECEDPGDNPTCHEHANCTDTEGSYECTCNTGFSGDGFNCSGLNSIHVEIMLLVSLIICLFTSDVNECELDMDQCATNATCSNTEGSYECSCNTGFTGDGRICCKCL